MKKLCLSLLIAMLAVASAYAQMTMVSLDSVSNGTVVSFDSTTSVGLTDNGGPEGRYLPGDYYVTVNSDCREYRFCLQISVLDISCRDTLYIYDGPDTNSAIRAKINNCTGHTEGQRIFVSASNNTGVLTVRFRAVEGSSGGNGFSLDAQCGIPCEKVVPVIDSLFYRVRDGVVYDSAFIRDVPKYDTVWNFTEDGDTVGIDHVDTNYFKGAHLCVGDSVIFHGHGE